ncbi:hypothetical protein DFJ74DRAFT_466743 [Hyaloraphidium curvatum]|nr:hypothetical protein DFJ74DRAFT_466743 [Hyaloraphidium curvatum]
MRARKRKKSFPVALSLLGALSCAGAVRHRSLIHDGRVLGSLREVAPIFSSFFRFFLSVTGCNDGGATSARALRGAEGRRPPIDSSWTPRASSCTPWHCAQLWGSELHQAYLHVHYPARRPWISNVALVVKQRVGASLHSPCERAGQRLAD